MTEQERLTNRLIAAGVTDFKPFPGSNADITPEELAKEINRSLDAILSGDFTEVTDDGFDCSVALEKFKKNIDQSFVAESVIPCTADNAFIDKFR